MNYDNVNHPSHYIEGRQFEVIDVIEDWAQFAPDVKQGIALGNALKYLSRIWTKGDVPFEHVSKAIWYLQRLQGHIMDEHLLRPDELDYGDSMPWDPVYWDPDSPYNHPDTLHFGNSVSKSVGLEGGIGDEDLPEDQEQESEVRFYKEILGYRDFEFHVDVDRHKDTWTA